MSDRETPGNPTPLGFPGPDFEIFVINADGSNQTQITFNELDDENPAWSPTGRKIVFMRDLDPVRGQINYDIFTMKADGSNQQNRTTNPAVEELDPNWSPNGRRIAFSSDRDGDNEIYSMKPDGSRVRQLTRNDGPFDAGLNWSPDGRKIAFSSFRDATEDNPDNVEIYTMRADGSDPARLTQNPLFDIAPDWQPLDKR
jgi:TolB protein